MGNIHLSTVIWIIIIAVTGYLAFRRSFRPSK